MSNSYTIEKVVAIQQTPNHIPYVHYVILRGPRGGRIFCDYYNFERIILDNYNYYISGRIERHLISYATKMSLIVKTKLPEAIFQNNTFTEFKYLLQEDKSIKVKLIRNNNIQLRKRITKHLRLDNWNNS